MATNLRNSAGVEFDDLFDLYVEGPKPANTGFRTSDGVDLRERYAPIAFGSKGPNVNYRDSAGIDLSNKWAAKGTAVYKLGFDSKRYNIPGVTGSPGNSRAAIRLVVNADGTWQVQRNTNFAASTWSTVDSGTWLPSGVAAGSYSGQFVHFFASGIGNSQVVTNGASSYSVLSTTRIIEIAQLSTSAVPSSADGNISLNMRRSSGTVTTSSLSFDLHQV